MKKQFSEFRKSRTGFKRQTSAIGDHLGHEKRVQWVEMVHS